MTRRVMVALGIVTLLGGAAWAADADITSAQDRLKEARAALKGAGGGFGGHRERAMDLIDRALAELAEAQHVDTRRDAKNEQKVNRLEKKDQHLEQRIDRLKQKSN